VIVVVVVQINVSWGEQICLLGKSGKIGEGL
jgi:hypothetical protein